MTHTSHLNSAESFISLGHKHRGEYLRFIPEVLGYNFCSQESNYTRDSDFAQAAVCIPHQLMLGLKNYTYKFI